MDYQTAYDLWLKKQREQQAAAQAAAEAAAQAAARAKASHNGQQAPQMDFTEDTKRRPPPAKPPAPKPDYNRKATDEYKKLCDAADNGTLTPDNFWTLAPTMKELTARAQANAARDASDAMVPRKAKPMMDGPAADPAIDAGYMKLLGYNDKSGFQALYNTLFPKKPPIQEQKADRDTSAAVPQKTPQQLKDEEWQKKLDAAPEFWRKLADNDVVKWLDQNVAPVANDIVKYSPGMLEYEYLVQKPLQGLQDILVTNPANMIYAAAEDKPVPAFQSGLTYSDFMRQDAKRKGYDNYVVDAMDSPLFGPAVSMLIEGLSNPASYIGASEINNLIGMGKLVPGTAEYQAALNAGELGGKLSKDEVAAYQELDQYWKDAGPEESNLAKAADDTIPKQAEMETVDPNAQIPTAEAPADANTDIDVNPSKPPKESQIPSEDTTAAEPADTSAEPADTAADKPAQKSKSPAETAKTEPNPADTPTGGEPGPAGKTPPADAGAGLPEPAGEPNPAAVDKPPAAQTAKPKVTTVDYLTNKDIAGLGEIKKIQTDQADQVAKALNKDIGFVETNPNAGGNTVGVFNDPQTGKLNVSVGPEGGNAVNNVATRGLTDTLKNSGDADAFRKTVLDSMPEKDLAAARSKYTELYKDSYSGKELQDIVDNEVATEWASENLAGNNTAAIRDFAKENPKLASEIRQYYSDLASNPKLPQALQKQFEKASQAYDDAARAAAREGSGFGGGRVYGNNRIGIGDQRNAQFGEGKTGLGNEYGNKLNSNDTNGATGLTTEQLLNKPKYSPNPNIWQSKGGRVTVDGNNVWTYHDWEGHSVSYPDGYPDFKAAGMVKQEVELGKFSDYETDFRYADEHAPNGPKSNVNTWHHYQDLTTMQEVDRILHKRFTHEGGVAISRRGGISLS